jgi:hypothetical protein
MLTIKYALLHPTTWSNEISVEIEEDEVSSTPTRVFSLPFTTI